MYFLIYTENKVPYYVVHKMRGTVVISVVFACLTSFVGPAYAHPMLDRGVAHYENADFEAAIRTFDQASRNADLSVEELLRLFEMRALVHHAVGDEHAMREDLRRVAAVRPSYQLSALAPPQVMRAFNQILLDKKKVELRIEEVSEGREWSMKARVLRVPDQLVDHVTLNCTVGASGTAVSRTSKGKETSIDLPRRGAYSRCDATARTRQGGVLFHAVIGETRTSPAPAEAFQLPTYQDRADEPKRKRWPWFVAAAAVLVAGGITAGVVASNRSSDSTQPTLGGATVSW